MSSAPRPASPDLLPLGLADPKPPKRHTATAGEWERIRQHFQFACCVSCGLRHQHLHHIAFRRADRGDDVVLNLAPMCNPCHMRFHSHGPGWKRIAGHIRSYIVATPERHLYVLEKIGLGKLNRRYPQFESEDVEGYSR